ncbi:hypothetical protein BU15DRAFT_71185 [Melanogaster broomeanus]|nr:hypothetical protein BU15DRAFT_71185 [Melanogaster broomeanus]
MSTTRTSRDGRRVDGTNGQAALAKWRVEGHARVKRAKVRIEGPEDKGLQHLKSIRRNPLNSQTHHVVKDDSNANTSNAKGTSSGPSNSSNGSRQHATAKAETAAGGSTNGCSKDCEGSRDSANDGGSTNGGGDNANDPGPIGNGPWILGSVPDTQKSSPKPTIRNRTHRKPYPARISKTLLRLTISGHHTSVALRRNSSSTRIQELYIRLLEFLFGILSLIIRIIVFKF